MLDIVVLCEAHLFKTIRSGLVQDHDSTEGHCLYSKLVYWTLHTLPVLHIQTNPLSSSAFLQPILKKLWEFKGDVV